VVLSQKIWRALVYMNWIDQLYVQPKWLTEPKIMSSLNQGSTLNNILMRAEIEWLTLILAN